MEGGRGQKHTFYYDASTPIWPMLSTIQAPVVLEAREGDLQNQKGTTLGRNRQRIQGPASRSLVRNGRWKRTGSPAHLRHIEDTRFHHLSHEDSFFRNDLSQDSKWLTPTAE